MAYQRRSNIDLIVDSALMCIFHLIWWSRILFLKRESFHITAGDLLDLPGLNYRALAMATDLHNRLDSSVTVHALNRPSWRESCYTWTFHVGDKSLIMHTIYTITENKA
jgi:hypothetical protein